MHKHISFLQTLKKYKKNIYIFIIRSLIFIPEHSIDHNQHTDNFLGQLVMFITINTHIHSLQIVAYRFHTGQA